MTDFILSTPDQATMVAAFKSLGFWDNVNSVPILQGNVPGDPDPSHAFVMNLVGVVSYQTGVDGQGKPVFFTEPGYWARLRINSPVNPFENGTFSTPVGVTVYKQVNIGTPDTPNIIWTADGSTSAPSYVPTIGMFA